MKKVLEGELTSLAHSILKSKGDNVHELKEKVGVLYEKLCVLSFAEKHFAGSQPNIGKAAFKSAFETDLDEAFAAIATPKDTPEDREEKVASTEENSVSEKAEEVIEDTQEEQTAQQDIQEETKQDTQETEPIFVEKTEDEEAETNKTSANEPTNKPDHLAEEDFGVHFDELPDFEPAESKANTIENIEKPDEEVKPATSETKNTAQNPVENELLETEQKAEKETDNSTVEKPKKRTMDLFSQEKKSLNDQLKTELKIGLNDRLAFTKNLFEGNVEAYNRVLGKMNELSNFNEAKNYLETHVIPNYNWENHEATAQRFIEILEAKLG